MRFSRISGFVVFWAFILIIHAQTALAGWVVEEADGTKVYVSDGKLKYADEGGYTWVVYDTHADNIAMVNPHSRTYAEGSVGDYCSAVEKIKEQALSGLSPEERRMVEELRGAKEDKARPAVEVLEEGSGGDIAGLATVKYKVLADGVLYEELWIAPEAPVLGELDMESFSRMSSEFSSCMTGGKGMRNLSAMVEASPAYSEVFKAGWIMKSVDYSEGSTPRTETNVKSFSKVSLSADELGPPEGYTRVSIEKFFISGSEEDF